jgi:hypothetical protein
VSEKNGELLQYWWSDYEEIIISEAFETREQAYSDAYCYRAECFDDPAENDGFFLHYGKMVENPDYDADYAKEYGFCEDNSPLLFEGTTERIDAITVTDFFHDQWVKSHTPASVQKLVDALETIYKGVMTDINWSEGKTATIAGQALSAFRKGE